MKAVLEQALEALEKGFSPFDCEDMRGVLYTICCRLQQLEALARSNA